MPLRPLRPEEWREDVCSDDAETITFNYLQQRPVEDDEDCPTPVEALGTTDPLGVVTEGS